MTPVGVVAEGTVGVACGCVGVAGGCVGVTGGCVGVAGGCVGVACVCVGVAGGCVGEEFAVTPVGVFGSNPPAVVGFETIGVEAAETGGIVVRCERWGTVGETVGGLVGDVIAGCIDV